MGCKRDITQGGLDDVISALTKGQHERYLDDPSSLVSEEVRDDGNKILGHVLGSKDVSRQAAAQASQQTGISESILKQMLPAVASLAMGALSKGTTTSSASAAGMGNMASAALSGRGNDIMGLLTPLLDRNADGSVKDDILGLVSGFFKNDLQFCLDYRSHIAPVCESGGAAPALGISRILFVWRKALRSSE